MNRRAFIATAGTAVAVAATSPKRSLFAQSPSPSPIYSTSASVSNLTTGNTYVQPTTSAGNWNAYRNTLISVTSDWQANGYDAQLAPHYAALTTTNCKSSNLNQAQILASVQATYPSVTLAQLQAAWAITDGMSPLNVSETITNIKQNGLVPYLNSAVQQALLFSEAASTSASAASVSRISPDASLPPGTGDPKGGGGCSTSATYAADAIGLAFLTIGIMSGVGAIAEGAAWAAIAAWGGGSVTAFNVGQHIFC